MAKSVATMIVLFGLSLPMSGCIELQPTAPPFVVNVQGHGSECIVRTVGERVTGARLLEIARSSPNRHGIVVYDKNAPYKCVGAAILTLQKAGLRTVDSALWDEN